MIYREYPEKMSSEYFGFYKDRGEDLDRVICDYISGMTDRYCIATFEQLFVPKVWR